MKKQTTKKQTINQTGLDRIRFQAEQDRLWAQWEKANPDKKGQYVRVDPVFLPGDWA